MHPTDKRLMRVIVHYTLTQWQLEKNDLIKNIKTAFNRRHQIISE